MGRTVGELKRTLSAAEFELWQVYHLLSPITPDREDFRAGIVACTVANTQRTRTQRAYKPEDFTIQYERKPRRVMTTEEMQAQILKVARLKNG